MDYQNVQPKWIRFFEKDMYHQYQNFMKARDFTKILSPPKPAETKPGYRQGVTSHPAEVSIANPDAEYSEIPEDRPLPPVVLHPTAAEVRARKKRTRTYVLLGILVMSLVAMLVAVLLHFHVQKSLFGGPSTHVRKNRLSHQGGHRSNRIAMAFPSSLNTGANVRTGITRERNAVHSAISQARQNTERRRLNGVISKATSRQQATSMPNEESTSLTAGNVLKSREYIILTCLLQGTSTWTRIAVVELNQVSPDQSRTLAEVHAGAKRDPTSSDPRATARYILSGSDDIFLVNITSPVCRDNGLYACVANITPTTVLTTRFKVDISCK